MARLYGRSTFSFVRNHQGLSAWLDHQQGLRVPAVLHTHQHQVWSVFQVSVIHVCGGVSLLL